MLFLLLYVPTLGTAPPPTARARTNRVAASAVHRVPSVETFSRLRQHLFCLVSLEGRKVAMRCLVVCALSLLTAAACVASDAGRSPGAAGCGSGAACGFPATNNATSLPAAASSVGRKHKSSTPGFFPLYNELGGASYTVSYTPRRVPSCCCTVLQLCAVLRSLLLLLPVSGAAAEVVTGEVTHICRLLLLLQDDYQCCSYLLRR